VNRVDREVVVVASILVIICLSIIAMMYFKRFQSFKTDGDVLAMRDLQIPSFYVVGRKGGCGKAPCFSPALRSLFESRRSPPAERERSSS